jgi:putative redox protein
MYTATAKYEQGKMKHEILVGTHHFVSDISEKEGGENIGPSPHDFLAAALAACTAITLRMYAGRKSWPLKSADTTVNLDHQKGLVKFDRQIHLVGDLSNEQRQRLLDIANRCPVHEALSSKIEISTILI